MLEHKVHNPNLQHLPTPLIISKYFYFLMILQIDCFKYCLICDILVQQLFTEHGN